MSALDTFLPKILSIKDKYTLVVPDTPDFPAYSQILLKQCASYFNTVIVTADIDEGLVPHAVHSTETLNSNL